MTDTEFIEKVREIISLPSIIRDEEFAKNYKSSELEYVGIPVNRRLLISKLLKQYDSEKAGIN